jgi:hypothetical protein
VIAVLAPGMWLAYRGEAGRWTMTGLVWSLAAGSAGALGALGIILAFQNHGNPLYVMPLVFGGAPVINTFMSMAMSRSYKQANPFFLAGLLLVIAGAVTVLAFKPPTGARADAPGLQGADLLWVALATALTAFSWGVYGPVLHKGQSAMGGSKLRPLICVGLAYFLIAVLLPIAVLTQFPESGDWNFSGTVWSLAAGAAGAVGALGIIMAFNFGGKPVYVMPLVFGGAPVINTFVALVTAKEVGEVSPLFYAGLIVVAVGAVTVLVFAPKGGHKPASAKKADPTPAAV